MASFGRPVARRVWSNCLRPLATTAPGRVAFTRLDVASNSHSICSRCSIRPLASASRPYSTRPTSNDTEVPSTASENDAPRDLPSNKEMRRSSANKRFSHVMDNLQSRFLNASHTLNDLTGYSEIEGIKAENKALESALAEAHERLRTARQAYKTSNSKRANTQREVTTLLARKDSWSPVDLERFTELYRTDHVLEGEVANAQESLTEAEAEEQHLGQKLNAGILRRYHEEQIWSDRIRRASTWGTWGLMGMNFILFVVLQFVAEPWRRRRLVRGVVAEEKGVLEEVRNELADVKAELKATAAAVKLPERPSSTNPLPTSRVDEGPAILGSTSWSDVLLDPAKWKLAAGDLCSERKVDLRMRDASILALQGAVAGAAIVGSTVLLLARRP